MKGYFESESFFRHRQNRIKELLAPPAYIKEALFSNHSILASEKYTVGLQVRDYRFEQPTGKYHPTLDASYYDAAMSRFPNNAMFIVSSNNETYAKHVTKNLRIV